MHGIKHARWAGEPRAKQAMCKASKRDVQHPSDKRRKWKPGRVRGTPSNMQRRWANTSPSLTSSPPPPDRKWKWKPGRVSENPTKCGLQKPTSVPLVSPISNSA